MILRSTIVKLLQHRIGLFTSDGTGEIPPAKSHIPTTQQVNADQHFLNITLCCLHLSLQVLQALTFKHEHACLQTCYPVVFCLMYNCVHDMPCLESGHDMLCQV